jgi:hypothetical protein
MAAAMVMVRVVLLKPTSDSLDPHALLNSSAGVHELRGTVGLQSWLDVALSFQSGIVIRPCALIRLALTEPFLLTDPLRLRQEAATCEPASGLLSAGLHQLVPPSSSL